MKKEKIGGKKEKDYRKLLQPKAPSSREQRSKGFSNIRYSEIDV